MHAQVGGYAADAHQQLGCAARARYVHLRRPNPLDCSPDLVMPLSLPPTPLLCESVAYVLIAHPHARAGEWTRRWCAITATFHRDIFSVCASAAHALSNTPILASYGDRLAIR